MTRPQPTDVDFTDALAGIDSWADPAPSMRPAEVYTDATASVSVVDAPRVVLPEVPVPELPDPSDFFDLEEPHPTRRSGSAAHRRRAAPAGPVPQPASAQVAVRPAGHDRAPSPAWPAPSVPQQQPPPVSGGQPPVWHHADRRGFQHAGPRPAVAPSTRSGQRAPVAPPHAPGGRRPTTGKQKKTGGAWGLVVMVVFFLLLSGAGRDLLDSLMRMLGQ